MPRYDRLHGESKMTEEILIGQWVSENYRIVGFVEKLAIIENIPGCYYDIKHIQYFVRIGINDYVRADGTAGLFCKALFDTQAEAEQLAKEYLALQAAESKSK